MCTAINETSKFHLFGRTLDLEYSYDEKVVITPRRFTFSFIHEGKSHEHFAMIGAAHIADGTPLYYDGMNEKGLCVAALRFPELTVYHEKKPRRHNLASFELIPWILCNFESAEEAKEALLNVNVTPESFSNELQSTPLHWIVGDGKQSFVVESFKDGVKIYDNDLGVLTNAPDFQAQRRLLQEHSDHILGDLSSTSRFMRAVNAKEHTEREVDKTESISRFFHVLGTVNQPNGLFRADERKLRTVYTSCMDTDGLTYYFTTYSCRKIRGVRLKNAHLDLESLTAYQMSREEWFHYYN